MDAMRTCVCEQQQKGMSGGREQTCTIDSRASKPSRWAPLGFTGTPITGSGVRAATMPGKCAAPPAPAIMTCPNTHLILQHEPNRYFKECHDCGLQATILCCKLPGPLPGQNTSLTLLQEGAASNTCFEEGSVRQFSVTFSLAIERFIGRTLMPRECAERAYSSMRSGVLCAETTVTSAGTPKSSKTCAAARMVARSESEPMIMPTLGSEDGSTASVKSPSMLQAMTTKPNPVTSQH